MPLKANLSLPLPKRLSLVAQTASALREALAGGYWHDRLPGERELSRTLEVSRPTLRAALAELQRSGHLKVSARSRRSITPKIPKNPAPSTLVIALSPLPLRMLTPTAILLVAALRDRLGLQGWTLKYQVSKAAFSRHPGRALAELTRRTSASLWLLIGSTRPAQQWFSTQPIRCLVCGTCGEDIFLPTVDADHHATARHAAGQFLRRRLRRVVLVRPDENTGGDNETEEGFRDGLSAEADVSFRVLRHRGRDHLVKLLNEALGSATPPQAYFVLRAAHALTVTMHLLRCGLKLPRDAAVISRDHEPYLEHTCPSIARYGIDPEVLARHVSRQILRLAETPAGLVPRVRLMHDFITGETL